MQLFTRLTSSSEEHDLGHQLPKTPRGQASHDKLRGIAEYLRHPEVTLAQPSCGEHEEREHKERGALEALPHTVSRSAVCWLSSCVRFDWWIRVYWTLHA